MTVAGFADEPDPPTLRTHDASGSGDLYVVRIDSQQGALDSGPNLFGPGRDSAAHSARYGVKQSAARMAVASEQ